MSLYSLSDKELLDFIITQLSSSALLSTRTINSNTKYSKEVDTLFMSGLDLVDINEVEKGLPSIPIVTIFIDTETDDNEEIIKRLPTVKYKTNLIMQIAYPNLVRKNSYEDCKIFAEDIVDFINGPDFQLNLHDKINLFKANQIKRLGAKSFRDNVTMASYRISFLASRS